MEKKVLSHIIHTENKLCPCCMEEHDVQTVLVDAHEIFKDESVDYKAEYFYCNQADEYYTDEAMCSQNDIRMKDAYREANGLLTSEDIREIRSKYGISQKDFCILLGWGEKTITRYEGHQVQDKAHDAILKKLDQDPEWFLQLLVESERNFPQKVFQEYRERANALFRQMEEKGETAVYKIMTPGPTQVRENVRLARSLECTNPDLDEEFFDYYRDTCRLISSLLDTKNETLILGGEGILGLEAVCASLTEPGDRVLVIDNGLYGKGFADFVSLYGGEPVLYTVSDREPVDVDALENYLREHHDFKYATVVHCDTPTGVLNAVDRICPLLKSYGILTVVDSVSAMFGEGLHVDAAQIDAVCGGSQKVVSAPPGLAFVALSEDAKAAMRERKIPIASFYANLTLLMGCYEKKWFPYTMPISDIRGLRTAMENIRDDEGRLERHVRIAAAVRTALTEAGLELFLKDGYSATVTAFCVPEETTDRAILDTMRREHHIMLADSFGEYAGKIIRIGHMGENANEEDVRETMRALEETLAALGVPTETGLEQAFLSAL